MLKAQWVILKSRKKVRLGQMPRVTGFGEQAQIGQVQLGDELGLAGESAPVVGISGPLDKGCHKKSDENQRQQQ